MDTPDVPPQVALLRLLNGFRATQLVALAARLGIADLLADGSRTAEDLAHATETQPDALYRALRALAGMGVFAELEGQRFALTPLSALLQSAHPESERAFALYISDEAYRTWADLPYSVTTGQPAFDHVYGASHWAYLAAHPDASEAFNQAMSVVAQREIVAMVAAYEFTGATRVVDVGGGQGKLLSAILQAHPALHGALFDLPHVAAGAEPTLHAAGVADRCDIVGGDFFTTVPPRGDLLTLSHILHDWDDARAAVIVRNCAQALEPQGKLLVIEDVIEPAANAQQTLLRDVQMLVMNGGRERTAAEFERLFTAAGLRLTRVIHTRTSTCIVEAERAEG